MARPVGKGANLGGMDASVMPVIREGQAPWHPGLRTYYSWACGEALGLLRSKERMAKVEEAVNAHASKCRECQEGQRDLMEKL